MAPVLVGIIIVFGIVTPQFLSVFNMQNFLRDASVLIVAAMGATLVFLIAGLDLSVGSTVAASGVGAAIVMQNTNNIVVSLAAGLAVGLAVGAVNGVLIGYARLVPFVLTLGTLLAVRAFAYLGSAAQVGQGGTAGAVSLPLEVTAFGRGVTWGLPNIFYVAIVVVAAVAILIGATRFGREVRLIGQNEKAAAFNGVNVKRVTFLVYTIAGLLSGIAGCLLALRLGAGNPASGDALLLQVITAVIIGGTALYGGHGGAVRSVFGAFVIVAIDRGLTLLGFQFWDQQIVLGLVILFGTLITRNASARRRIA
jgi:ribose transport system permease protein